MIEHPSKWSDPRVLRLQGEMAKLPQIELETRHHFCNGLYLREVVQPAGSLVVGKIHRKEHFLIVTKGMLAVLQDGETRAYGAGSIVLSSVNTKRVILATEDCVYLTVHQNASNDQNIDKIEDDLIVPEEGLLFDARNKLKELV